MPPEPDHDELTRHVTRLDALFDELRVMVNSILEWKSKITGGMTVMVWVVGGVQSVVLLCLGFAANALNETAEKLGLHAVELATAKAEIRAFMGEGPRFTADRNAASETALKSEIQQWVRDEIQQKHRQ